MSKPIVQERIAEKARIVDAPRIATTVDRTFELPRTLYGATVACYLGFLATMAVAFGNPGLLIPMTVCAFIIGAGFGVPAVWTRLQGTGARPAMGAGEFANRGIMTHTGRLKPRDAATQVLILPVLVVLWGLAVVTIVATI